MILKGKKVDKYVDSIETAPKNRSVVVFNHTPKKIYQVIGIYDQSWGGGRGGWFTEKGESISPKTWSPRFTSEMDRARKEKRKSK